MINSVTGLGAISGVKAMTVDFQGYTADMIEHHAATMPKEMGGWSGRASGRPSQDGRPLHGRLRLRLLP